MSSILEHDWKLIENKETTSKRLKSGIDFKTMVLSRKI